MIKKYISLIKMVIFISVLFLILLISSSLFNISTAIGIKNEPQNTIDYIVIGDSLAYRSISPMQIFNEKGYTGYNLGRPAQFLQNGFYSLKEALMKQKPKKVFVETNFIFRDRNLKSGIEQGVGIFIQEKLPIFENHNEWKTLFESHKNGLKTKKKESKDALKGFHINKEVKEFKGKESINKTEKKQELPTLTQYYLDQLVELSKEKGFELVFYSAPSPKNWTYVKHNSILEFTEINKIEYLDFNLAKDQVMIDWKKDTYDKGDHLNLNGAAKVTKIIGDYLQKKGTFIDRRSDKSYNNWNKLLSVYNNRVGEKKISVLK
ncbi:TPA: hypothetical protein ACGBG5_003391 [Enterococcus faecalis]